MKKRKTSKLRKRVTTEKRRNVRKIKKENRAKETCREGGRKEENAEIG